MPVAQIICSIAIIQLIVFVFVLLFKKHNRLPNRILATFLAFQAIICFNYIVKTRLAINNETAFYFILIGDPSFWLVSPLLYFYVRSLCFSNFRFQFKDLFHTAPALILLIIIALYFITAGSIPLRDIPYISNMYNIENKGFLQPVLMYSQFLIYNILSLQVISAYRKKLKSQVSSIYRIFLSWLKIVIIGFMIAWIINLCMNVLVVFNITLNIDLAIVSFFAFLIFFNVLFFKGLSQSDLFSGIEETRRKQPSAISDTEAEKMLQSLFTYIEKEKPYLDAELSLLKLSEYISMPPNTVSLLIDEHIGTNFYDFITGYRIEMAKKLLVISTEDKTITDIQNESGFATKNIFYTAFKKETGFTPVDYRNKFIL